MRVLVADDHRLVRQSIVKAIGTLDDFEVVGEAGDGGEAVDLVRSLRPDVVLLDITMPGMDGLQAARVILELGVDPSPEIVFLSMHDDLRTIQRALDLGAAGYVSKDASLAEVTEALRAVGAGSSFLSPVVAAKVMDLASQREGHAVTRLTDRELEVLELLSGGARLDEIAERLFLSVKTVKNHLTSIYAKLGVSTGTQAVAKAYQEGLVNPTQRR